MGGVGSPSLAGRGGRRRTWTSSSSTTWSTAAARTCRPARQGPERGRSGPAALVGGLVRGPRALPAHCRGARRIPRGLCARPHCLGTDSSAMAAVNAGAPVTVAVVSWNTRELLLRCLAALRDDVEAARVQVVVVDNGSRDGSAAAAREHAPWAEVIEAPGQSRFGAAVNLVAARTSSEWLVGRQRRYRGHAGRPRANGRRRARRSADRSRSPSADAPGDGRHSTRSDPFRRSPLSSLSPSACTAQPCAGRPALPRLLGSRAGAGRPVGSRGLPAVAAGGLRCRRWL